MQGLIFYTGIGRPTIVDYGIEWIPEIFYITEFRQICDRIDLPDMPHPESPIDELVKWMGAEWV